MSPQYFQLGKHEEQPTTTIPESKSTKYRISHIGRESKSTKYFRKYCLKAKVQSMKSSTYESKSKSVRSQMCYIRQTHTFKSYFCFHAKVKFTFRRVCGRHPRRLPHRVGPLGCPLNTAAFAIMHKNSTNRNTPGVPTTK